MQDKRQVPRYRVYQPVRLHRPGSPQVMETLTKDLSAGGLRCITQTVLPVSTEVTLELVLAPGQEPLVARGRTMWFRSIPDSEQFDAGFAFTEINPINKRHLSAYLERLASKSSEVPAYA